MTQNQNYTYIWNTGFINVKVLTIKKVGTELCQTQLSIYIEYKIWIQNEPVKAKLNIYTTWY